MVELTPKYISFLREQEKALKRFLEAESLQEIESFNFNRFYDDGRSLLLGTNVDVLLDHLSRDIPFIHLPQEGLVKGNHLFSLVLLDDDGADIARRERALCGYGHRMYLFHFHDEYYDIFSFVTKGDGLRERELLVNSEKEFSHTAQNFLLRFSKTIEDSQYIEIPKSMQQPLRKNFYNKKIHVRFAPTHSQQIHLTPRELQALQLSCDGYTRKEAMNVMGIELSTYKGYFSTVCHKLGGTGKHLVQVARENHLIE